MSKAGAKPNLGVHFKESKKKRKKISVEHLVQKPSPYPTLVIPLGNDGSVNHAICVVDDLIFDSTQQFALKLCHKSFHWIAGELGSNKHVLGAIRFHRPVHSWLGTIERQIEKHPTI